jgi:hypothetical protein
MNRPKMTPHGTTPFERNPFECQQCIDSGKSRGALLAVSAKNSLVLGMRRKGNQGWPRRSPVWVAKQQEALRAVSISVNPLPSEHGPALDSSCRCATQTSVWATHVIATDKKCNIRRLRHEETGKQKHPDAVLGVGVWFRSLAISRSTGQPIGRSIGKPCLVGTLVQRLLVAIGYW